MVLVVPGHLIFMFMVHHMQQGASHAPITAPFATLYLTAAVIQVRTPARQPLLSSSQIHGAQWSHIFKKIPTFPTLFRQRFLEDGYDSILTQKCVM